MGSGSPDLGQVGAIQLARRIRPETLNSVPLSFLGVGEP